MSDGVTSLPDLSLETLQGESVALRADPPVARLLVFYRRDCESCAALLPAIERVSRSLHGKRLLTLGVSQSDADATLDAIIDHGLCFEQALDVGLVLTAALGVERVPALILADGDGAILDRCEGFELAAATRVLEVAARLCGVDEGEIGRVLGPFRLPASLPGSPARG